jgi:hypothetical protein
VVGNATAGAEIRLPEDTDNGSNYVALKAPDILAANLTLTLPTADGTSGQVLQTNGSGQLAFASSSSGTTQFTSSGSITAGQPVSLNSNGTVSTTTGINQATVFNTGTTYSSGRDYSFGSFYDSSTGWHFSGVSIAGYLYVLSYKVSSAGAITNINSVIIAIDSSSFTRGILFKHATTGNIIFMFGGNGPSTAYLFAASVNTTTGALTNAGLSGIQQTGYNPAGFDAYFDSFSNRVVVTMTQSGTGYVYTYNYNGSSFTYTAGETFSMANGSTVAIASAFNSNTNTGRVFYTNNTGTGGMSSRIISVNAAGNAITLGADLELTTSTYSNYAQAEYFPSIDRFLVQSNSSSAATSRLFTATGGLITSTQTTPLYALYYSWAQYGFSNSYDTVNNVAYCAAADGTGSTGLYTWSYTLTASSITYTNGSKLGSSNYTRGTSYTYDSALGRGSIAVRSTATDNTDLIGFLPGLF